MQENTLKVLIVKKLTEITVMKGIEFSKEQYSLWTEKIIDGYKKGKIIDIEKGFEQLEKEKVYGGLDYAVFLQGAKADENEEAEKAWEECLLSAKKSGLIPISARAGKALNSFGGMEWLKMSNPKESHFHRKDFINAYKNVPEPMSIDFRCLGQEAPMYLKQPEQKLLGGE